MAILTAIKQMEGDDISNYFTSNARLRSASQNVIAQLQYSDLWRNAGTLRRNEEMRVDMQGHISGPPIKYNIQVQVNGISGNSTVAHVIVSSSIQCDDPANQKGALRAVIAALNKSLDTGKSYTVTGTSP